MGQFSDTGSKFLVPTDPAPDAGPKINGFMETHKRRAIRYNYKIVVGNNQSESAKLMMTHPVSELVFLSSNDASLPL